MSKRYGINYQGSKSQIAEKIIAVLPSGGRFVDLFGGGAAMMHAACVSPKYKKVLYNEKNELLFDLIERAIDGDFNLSRFKPRFIDSATFESSKNKDGYIKYVWSFNNDGRCYLFAKEKEATAKALHNFVVFREISGIINTLPSQEVSKIIKMPTITARRLATRRVLRMQQLERLAGMRQLERLALQCGDYRDYEYQDGDVVYCDPPYEGTKRYAIDFNHQEFYDWAASRPFRVFFSSYNNITDKRFKMIWAVGKRSLMQGGQNALKSKMNYECLYTNDSTHE